MKLNAVKQGFTLIEVIAALAVASIALLGLLRLQLISMAISDKADILTGAVLLGQSRLAEIEASGFPRLGTASGSVQQLHLCRQQMVSEHTQKTALTSRSFL